MKLWFHASLQNAKITKTKEKAKKSPNAFNLWRFFSNFALSYHKNHKNHIKTKPSSKGHFSKKWPFAFL